MVHSSLLSLRNWSRGVSWRKSDHWRPLEAHSEAAWGCPALAMSCRTADTYLPAIFQIKQDEVF